jgi:hypothetical protein
MKRRQGGRALAMGLCTVIVMVQALLSSALPADAAASTTQVPQNLSSSDQGCTVGNGQPVAGTPWPGLAADLGRAWELSKGGSTTVALLDTGVDIAGVPQLAGQVTPGQTATGQTAPVGQDCVGHGTFEAALIAGKQDNVSGFSGVAPETHVLPVTVTDAGGNLTPDTIAAGIQDAVAAGAKIIACGVAATTTDSQLDTAVKQAISAGALVIAPAEIDGQNQAGSVYPAADDGVLSVGDMGSSDASTTSSQVTGSPVDLVAPGDDITSVGVGGSAFVAAGASYATAFVAGTVALIDAYRGPASPADLIRRLEATAIHPGTTMPDPTTGYGLVDPDAAVASVLPADNSTPVTPTPAASRLTVAAPPRHPARSVAILVAIVALGTLCVAALGLLTARARAANRSSRVDDDKVRTAGSSGERLAG